MNIVEIKKKEGLIDSWKFLWEKKETVNKCPKICII